MIVHYVYLLQDLNGNTFYVGKGTKKKGYNRMDYHIKYWMHNKNRKLKNRIKKLGGEFSVIIVFESLSECECLNKEMTLIEQYGKHKLCNLTDGGEGASSYKHTMQTKTHMSLAKSVPDSIKTAKTNLLKAKEANTGRRKAATLGIENLYTKHTIREIVEITGLSFNTIKSFLLEKGLYIKNKNRKPMSESGRQNISKGQLLRKRKRVLQLDLQGNLVRIWSNANQATIEVEGDIIACLRGKQKTAGGFIWKYEQN
jgi:hypothetical protein